MRRAILFFSLFALFISLITGCCVNNTTPLNPTEASKLSFVKHLDNSTVVLLAKDDDSYYRTLCSGVWINKTQFLTARHCAEAPLENSSSLFEPPMDLKKLPGTIMPFKLFSENHVKIKIDEYRINSLPHFAVVIAYDPDSDLALLSSIENDLSHDIVKISNKEIYDGMPVHIVGHPGGMDYSYFPGVVSSNVREMDPFGITWKVTQISAPVIGGNSGGGAFEDTGELIGICSFTKRNGGNMAFYIHRDSIVAFLKNEFVRYF